MYFKWKLVSCTSSNQIKKIYLKKKVKPKKNMKVPFTPLLFLPNTPTNNTIPCRVSRELKALIKLISTKHIVLTTFTIRFWQNVVTISNLCKSGVKMLLKNEFC